MKRSGPVYFTCFLLVGLMTSCRNYIDKGIKESITGKAKKEIAFLGVRYTVANQQVTLSGYCPNEALKQKVYTTVSDLAGVKKIVNNIVIAPVVLTSDVLIQRSVDSALAAFPQLSGTVKDSMVTLQGSISPKQQEKLIRDLQRIGARQVTVVTTY